MILTINISILFHLILIIIIITCLRSIFCLIWLLSLRSLLSGTIYRIIITFVILILIF